MKFDLMTSDLNDVHVVTDEAKDIFETADLK